MIMIVEYASSIETGIYLLEYFVHLLWVWENCEFAVLISVLK